MKKQGRTRQEVIQYRFRSNLAQMLGLVSKWLWWQKDKVKIFNSLQVRGLTTSKTGRLSPIYVYLISCLENEKGHVKIKSSWSCGTIISLKAQIFISTGWQLMLSGAKKNKTIWNNNFDLFFLSSWAAQFNKSCNLIGSGSGRNFPIRPAIHCFDLFFWTNQRLSSVFCPF